MVIADNGHRCAQVDRKESTLTVISLLHTAGDSGEHFPDKSSLWSGLAISLDAQGEYEAALKSYQHALDDHALAPELRRYAQRRVTALRDTVSGEQS